MSEDEEGQVQPLPEDARLDSLEQRLGRAKAPATDANEQMGQRVLSYLLGGLFGGTLLGWIGDRLLGTGHTLLIAGLILGIVGAFYSIWKVSGTRA